MKTPMTQTRKILGQPSWELSSKTVSLAVTRTGGHMAPVRFRLGSREVEPFSIAPWAEEKLPPETPAMLRSLRGDFFCAPFGGNSKPYRGEMHPPHGESANAEWSFKSLHTEGRRHTLHLSMQTNARLGKVDKHVEVRDGESVVYCRHTLSGMSGPMSFGHHAMLKFPDKDASGCVSTSRISFAQVAPLPFETPAMRGYQSLRVGAIFKRLDRVPSALGGHADLSLYPARRGYEDLVTLIHSSRKDFAWSSVTFPDEEYLWFSLKDPRVLRQTILWISNGGRHYPPWNGRHVNVLGVEDVTSFFHYGLAESACDNSLSRLGYPTSVGLDKRVPLSVSYIMGVAALPKGFRKVKSIVPNGDHIAITSSGGHRLEVALDTTFLQEQNI